MANLYTKDTDDTSCWRAECGTKIFAYFNLVLVCVTAIFSLIMVIYIVVGVFVDVANERTVSPLMIPPISIFILLMVLSAKSIVFAVLLFRGVQKKKPQYIKAYFIYGVIVASLSLFSELTVVTTGSSIALGVGISGAAISVIYCCILLMIWKTYKKLVTQQSQFQHASLSEKL